MLDSNLTSHFIAARTFLPVLQRGSTYTLIGGGAADKAIPNYGLVCIPEKGRNYAYEYTNRGKQGQWRSY